MGTRIIIQGLDDNYYLVSKEEYDKMEAQITTLSDELHQSMEIIKQLSDVLKSYEILEEQRRKFYSEMEKIDNAEPEKEQLE